MTIVEVIPARRWRNVVNNNTASIYGSVPWTSEKTKSDWTMEEYGWTWRMSNGTIGIGAQRPVKTKEEAEMIMEAFNRPRYVASIYPEESES